MLHLLETLAGTQIAGRLTLLEQIYLTIEKIQTEWKKASALSCPDGCGMCCTGFEPDVLEEEALYLAAWLLENKRDTAVAIMNGAFVPEHSENPDGCILFNYDSPYHCTVYDGRCLICRLFGFSGDRGKDGKPRWKPCRFLPSDLLIRHTPPLEHRQYMADELEQLFGTEPPAMSDSMEQALSLSPDEQGRTIPLRIALPEALRKVQFIIQYTCMQNDNKFSPDNSNAPESA
jgi:uncharacterized protein